MYGPVRTVVWQGSVGDRRPYADLVGNPAIENRSGVVPDVSAFIESSNSFLANEDHCSKTNDKGKNVEITYKTSCDKNRFPSTGIVTMSTAAKTASDLLEGLSQTIATIVTTSVKTARIRWLPISGNARRR